MSQLSEFYPDIIQAELLDIDFEKKLLICFCNESPGKQCIVRYDIDPENREFTASAEQFWAGAKLNLINSVSDNNGMLIPTYLILEPDYLIDASSIAECFQDYLISPLHFFRNRFEEMENKSYLLLGNLANFFLDELVFADNIKEVSFNDVFLKSFRQQPFEYTSCEDIRGKNKFREFMSRAHNLFNNIKRVVRDDFPKMGIDVNNCTLEPSFFSVKYGFQGRLDLLYTSKQQSAAKIIELKSGRLPYPQHDSRKVALNHMVQTYVYRLMVDSVFSSDNYNVDASILYASGDVPGENIRKAGLSSELEKLILNLRNHIIINEHKIISCGADSVEELFLSMFREGSNNDGNNNNGRKLPQFYLNRVGKFKSVLEQCSATERTYFYRFTQFISKELYHHKIGDRDYETPTGIASLWNSDFHERADALDVIYNLTINQIDDSGNDMTIVFGRDSNKSNELVNFREGEICIVYPRNNEDDTVLNKQILKGSIVQITSGKVVVRFRYKQKNRRYFEENELWAVEHDSLDTSYNNMYKSLYSFISAPKEKRELLMGLREPGNGDNSESNEIIENRNSDINVKNSNESIREAIIRLAVGADDYFLIVGPPGTGKTSIFARRLIEEFYSNPETNIMVIAYTNRAVDELCDAVNAAFGFSEGECNKYIRIGSELSCAPEFRHRLLQNVSGKTTDRFSLLNEINETRIFVSTLASINGKQELFALKEFQVAIIDEASQILESQIIGLLPKFQKFIMIGDHNQLPAIVLQDEESSRITEPELTEIGITDCRISLFERLLRNCISGNLDHAYTQLTHQGRMHIDIAEFPSSQFYFNSLFPAVDWQTEEWNLNYDPEMKYDQHVATKRTMFFSTEKIPYRSPSTKINETEADIIVDILKSIHRVYMQNDIKIDSKKIGIIAPYRNQIALIRHKLQLSGTPDSENIMIDTVERFQGSQRDIIIVSFCINQAEQFKYLCSLNHDGSVDRKLNVALTRARKQFFLVGNTHLLKQQPIYASLVEFYKDKTIALCR